jgi:hypothetical protein
VQSERTLHSQVAEAVRTVTRDPWWRDTPLMQLHRALLQDRLELKQSQGLRPMGGAQERPVESGVDRVKTLAKVFDPGRFPSTISGLVDGRPMSEEVFQRQLYKCLNLRLSRPETREVLRIFDNNRNTEIDGAEFLSHFFKFGQAARYDQHIQDVRCVCLVVRARLLLCLAGVSMAHCL